MTQPPVTTKEIELIIERAQNAPLANMRDAAALSLVLQRFRQWAYDILEPVDQAVPETSNVDAA
jgi:hypothetical protein